jgi:hypothetical protein
MEYAARLELKAAFRPAKLPPVNVTAYGAWDDRIAEVGAIV